MRFNNLESFIAKCDALLKSSDADIFIVGAGKYGKMIADILDKHSIEWECYVDRIKTGTYDGRRILSYEECRNRKGFYVIASIRYREDILNDIINLIGVSDDDSIAYFSDSMKQLLDPNADACLGNEALEYVLKNYAFCTVLDVGCGEGIQSNIFLEHGKNVTALDYGNSFYFKKRQNNNDIKLIIADINKYEGNEVYDLVWCSAVLEHQLNPHSFLCKLHSLVKENGILAITVPSLDTQTFVHGGHVSLWNAGVLLYHLVLAGFDCSDAHIKRYGGNISVVLEKRSVNVLDEIDYDRGDIRKLRKYLPVNIQYINAGDDDHFLGDIECLNWITE